MNTVGNTVLAQNFSFDIPLPESDHHFGIVHRQISLSKVASQKMKNVIFCGNEMFCDKSTIVHCVRVALPKNLNESI